MLTACLRERKLNSDSIAETIFRKLPQHPLQSDPFRPSLHWPFLLLQHMLYRVRILISFVIVHHGWQRGAHDLPHNQQCTVTRAIELTTHCFNHDTLHS